MMVRFTLSMQYIRYNRLSTCHMTYIMVGAYLVKISFAQSERWSIKAVGLGASLYGIWLIYAAGIDNLLLSLLLYIPGLMIFCYSRYQARQQTIQNKL